MIGRYFFTAVFLAALVAVSVAMKEPSRKYWHEQDHSKFIKFSHTFHVKDQSVACEDCHTAVKTSKASSDTLIPNHENCKTCHEEQVSSNCTFCHLTHDNIVPIPRPERELVFSHELHVAKQSLKCETCHSGMDTAVFAGKDNMPAMELCMSCHTQQKISANCETCHRDFVTLVPEGHLASDFRKDHKKLTRLGMREVSCKTCHSENFCQDCHSGTELRGFASTKDLMADPSPRSSTKDNPRQLRLQQVHSLNYRLTHGIDAKSKAFDCASCHEQQTFCVTCHEAGGNITEKKFKPVSHNVAGFTTIGRGSGGGRHAQLARRDIESCAACHDVQGNDPTCTLCHTENGGVR